MSNWWWRITSTNCVGGSASGWGYTQELGLRNVYAVNDGSMSNKRECHCFSYDKSVQQARCKLASAKTHARRWTKNSNTFSLRRVLLALFIWGWGGLGWGSSFWLFKPNMGSERWNKGKPSTSSARFYTHQGWATRNEAYHQPSAWAVAQVDWHTCEN